MAETCESTHPEQPSVVCSKPVHPFGAHYNVDTGQVWPGVPMPERRGSKKAPKGARTLAVVRAIDEAGTGRRTGPPSVGEQRRDVVLDNVRASSDLEYRVAFARAFETVLETGEPFTSEDVTALALMPPEGTSPNQVGALFSAALRAAGSRVEYLGHVKAERANQNATRIGQYRRTT